MASKSLFFGTGIVVGALLGSVAIGVAYAESTSSAGAEMDRLVARIEALEQGAASNRNVLIEGSDSITLRTGRASIVMKKNGAIDINGTDISLTGSGVINVKSSKDVVIKGSKISQN